MASEGAEEVLCKACACPIQGDAMVGGEFVFHPSCFSCSVCMSRLYSGDTFALVDECLLFCNTCFRLEQASLSPIAEASAEDTHSEEEEEEVNEEEADGGFGSEGAEEEDDEVLHNVEIALDGLTEAETKKEKLEPDVEDVLTSRLGFEVATRDDGCHVISAVKEKSVVGSTCCLAPGDVLVSVNGQHTAELEEDKVKELLLESLSSKRCRVSVLRKVPSSGSITSSPLAAAVSAQASPSPPMPTSLSCPSLPPPPLYLSASMNNRRESAPDSNEMDSHPQTLALPDSTRPARLKKSNSRLFRWEDLEIGPILGSGFYGNVYKVTHKLSEKAYVLKELKNYDKPARISFLKEISLLKTFEHENVLRFVGVFCRDDKLELLTEFIEGGTLHATLMKKEVPLSWKTRLHMARDIANGMAYLHSKRVIHRDLTSNNCLIRSSGQIVVADFGLARVLLDKKTTTGSMDSLYSTVLGQHPPSSQQSSTPAQQQKRASRGSTPLLTITNTISSEAMPSSSASTSSTPQATSGTSGTKSTGSGVVKRRSAIPRDRHRSARRMTVVGSPYWMAPEMMKGFPYDEMVDVFSFGIILCEILARTDADPDFLPRTDSFGVDWHSFFAMVEPDCPKGFFELAIACCYLDPDQRPCFSDARDSIDGILSFGIDSPRGSYLPASAMMDHPDYI